MLLACRRIACGLESTWYMLCGGHYCRHASKLTHPELFFFTQRDPCTWMACVKLQARYLMLDAFTESRQGTISLHC